jgi:high-affinity nickel permease
VGRIRDPFSHPSRSKGSLSGENAGEKDSSSTERKCQRLAGGSYCIVSYPAGTWTPSRLTVLIGTAFLAYTFGLRHAVDADHIAAIDNVTRKLMQEGKRPISVGFFFSLGHSTIVVVASVVVYLTATVIATQLDTARSFSGIVGTSISAFFLIAIALVNILILRGVWQTFQEVRKGGGYTDQRGTLALDLSRLLQLQETLLPNATVVT